jgi:hypothetical protein
MSAQHAPEDGFGPFVYLDTGEVFYADEDGCATDKMAAVIAGDSEEADRVGELFAAAPELLALAHQYRNDLLYPPVADSRERRIAAIDEVIAKVGGR